MQGDFDIWGHCIGSPFLGLFFHHGKGAGRRRSQCPQVSRTLFFSSNGGPTFYAGHISIFGCFLLLGWSLFFITGGYRFLPAVEGLSPAMEISLHRWSHKKACILCTGDLKKSLYSLCCFIFHGSCLSVFAFQIAKGAHRPLYFYTIDAILSLLMHIPLSWNFKASLSSYDRSHSQTPEKEKPENFSSKQAISHLILFSSVLFVAVTAVMK